MHLVFSSKALTVFVEYREHDVDDVIAQVDVGDRLRNMLQCRLIDGSAGDVIKGEGGVYVVDVVQEVEEFQIIISGNALTVISKPATKINPVMQSLIGIKDNFRRLTFS